MVRLGKPKLAERERVVVLRKQGLTYSEILKQVRVAKSSVSLWLGEVGLTHKQQHRITEKKRAAQLRGGAARKRARIIKTEVLRTSASQMFEANKRDPLFLVGLALYWAEGSKQKEWYVSQGVAFSNMDVRTHRVMLTWLERYFGLSRGTLTYELYLHSTSPVHRAREYWATELSIPRDSIRVYKKDGSKKTLRRNTGETYYGVLRIRVPKSTDANRVIAAWIDDVIEYAL